MLLKQSGDIVIGFICILTPESKQHSKINFGQLHIFLSQGAWYIGPQGFSLCPSYIQLHGDHMAERIVRCIEFLLFHFIIDICNANGVK
jgi:hypothetical protein